MRNTLLASFFAHLVATLLFGAVSVALRRPLQPAEFISVNLASLPVVQPEKREAKRVEPQVVPPVPKEVESPAPEPEMDLKQPVSKKPTEQIVPPKPELPPPSKKEEPAAAPDEDFLEPEAPAPSEQATQDEAPPDKVAAGSGVQVEKHEGVPDYYLALLQRKIDRSWEPSAASTRGSPGVACMIRFRVSPAGIIQDPQIVEASGFSVFDREALRAVMSASPLPPPPPGSRASQVPINVRFHLEK